MFRYLNLAALFYAVACVGLLGFHYAGPSLSSIRPAPMPARGSGASWFAAIRPYCNPVEVEMRVASSPPPESIDGSAYSAVCFALAGKIDRARQVLQQVPSKDWKRAAGIVFEVAHPVADSGDNKSTAAIMRLVLEFDPNHVDALYHAGMAEYYEGEYNLAREHMSRFVNVYQTHDARRSNAMDLLNRL